MATTHGDLSIITDALFLGDVELTDMTYARYPKTFMLALLSMLMI